MGRIELRPQPVQDLTDENCYDLAWVPVTFLPADVAARDCAGYAPLRPGDWAVLGSLAAEGEGLQPAVLRLYAFFSVAGAYCRSCRPEESRSSLPRTKETR